MHENREFIEIFEIHQRKPIMHKEHEKRYILNMINA